MHPEQNLNPENKGRRARPDQSQPTKTRVMLVEDHRSYRESLSDALTERGFEIVGQCANGEEAPALAASTRPNVILMDVSLPGVDGIEVTREIRQANPQVAIVILTMHADQDMLSKSITAGATGYLVKDCSVDEIGSAITSVVAGETALSPNLAATVLAEVRKMDGAPKAERVITKREEEVLQMIANGCSTPEVAEELFISQKTVKNHLASIYQKLDARDRTQAVLQAVRMGIVTLD